MFFKMECWIRRGHISIHKQYISKRWRNTSLRFQKCFNKSNNKYANETITKKNKLAISGDDIKEV